MTSFPAMFCKGKPRMHAARALWHRLRAGFTAAEMVVAVAIAGVVVGSAALAYGTLTRNQRQFTSVATIRLPSSSMRPNFYPGQSSSSSITTFVAPNFGSLARAEVVREKFMADVTQSIAVFCLYRNNNVLNTIRPLTIPSPTDGSKLDTPEAFRLYLHAKVTGASTVFTQSYRNTGTTPNFSIFILGYSANATTIPVLAVYDLDMVQATDPNATSTVIGTYASLRRYVGTSLTAYYDVFYRKPVTEGPFTALDESFVPPVVAFERRSRLAVAEDSLGVDRFKKAAEQPFYFIFWPDPSEDSLAIPVNAKPSGVLNGSYSTTDPRRAYNHMGGRTSFMFTVPMFPSS
ncbi:MAG: prepilin-type N-terminal cleavage/methylation domain-containing protein [Roseimicrobium sp.]